MAFYFHAYTDIPDVKVIYPKRINDERGWFMESYVEREFLNNGIRLDFIQENHSCSQAGVFRGLHYQRYPYDQGKLVRCTRGSLTDYFMDMRQNSKTFGKLGSYKLTAKNSEMVWVPRGFAHGIHILEDDTEIMYKVDNVYAPTYECGVNPLSCIEFDEVPLLSEKDKAWPDFENAVYFS